MEASFQGADGNNLVRFCFAKPALSHSPPRDPPEAQYYTFSSIACIDLYVSEYIYYIFYLILYLIRYILAIMDIISFLKKQRKLNMMTQRDLAEKAGVGIHFIRDLEQGKKTLRMDKVNQVLALFGMELGPVKREIGLSEAPTE